MPQSAGRLRSSRIKIEQIIEPGDRLSERLQGLAVAVVLAAAVIFCP
ncbi:MAG: hypothetical protein MJA27_17655 [Pseudanabaenales cyanobacterium]|nr:hypothetical protein [Pseudanabaenales cyanobacterium]